jgi:hypothetical protein
MTCLFRSTKNAIVVSSKRERTRLASNGTPDDDREPLVF